MLVGLVQGGGIVKTGNIKEEEVLVAMIEGRRCCGANEEEPRGGDDNGWSESDEASASQQPDTNFHLVVQIASGDCNQCFHVKRHKSRQQALAWKDLEMLKQNVAGQWVPAEVAMALVSPESDLPDQAFIDYWLKLQKHVFQPSVDIGS